MAFVILFICAIVFTIAAPKIAFALSLALFISVFLTALYFVLTTD